MDRRMFRVIENFFTVQELMTLKLFSSKCLNMSKYVAKENYNYIHEKILEQVEDFIGNEETLGVEQWAFHSELTQLPDLHQDRDEELFDRTGKLSFPMCSCVAYLSVENLKGANLEIGEDAVSPKTGMLVLIAPGVWHKVSEYVSGKRHSLNYNFWNKPLYNS